MWKHVFFLKKKNRRYAGNYFIETTMMHTLKRVIMPHGVLRQGPDLDL